MDGFNSLEELYKRVTPALNSKIKDLRRIGINYIHKEDIWNYLKINCWCKKTNLTLGEMVNDIMTLSNTQIEDYVHDIISKEKREIIEEDVL